MRNHLATLVCLLFTALPASAVTLITENNDVFAINGGDVFDNVVMFDTSSITMSGGSVTGHFLMIDNTLATFTGGSVGSLDVFGEAVATIVIQSGTLDVDGVPTAEPVILKQPECASCTLSATLLNGDPVGPTPASALQGGQIKIEAVAVPEPTTAAMFFLGLFGLGLLPVTRRS